MVGEIISECRAGSNRNGGRDHSGMVGDIERNQQVDDKGRRRLYAFDFSRALFWTWPWNQSYPAAASNTRRWGAALRQLHGFDEQSALSTLEAIAGLAPGAIGGFVNQMPTDWLPANLHAEFVEVWTGAECGLRVDALRKGFKDGTLL
jgi:hypothetical protein